jgi:hypothetical protein
VLVVTRGVQKHDRVLRPASASGLRECL